jgi:hypothetical protein
VLTVENTGEKLTPKLVSTRAEPLLPRHQTHTHRLRRCGPPAGDRQEHRPSAPRVGRRERLLNERGEHVDPLLEHLVGARPYSGSAGTRLPRRLPRARRRRRASRGRRALTRQLHADPRQITETLETLRQHSLVDIADAGTITLSTAGRADYERLVAARRAGLRELLAGWHPDDHSDVMQLVERLSRDLVNEIPPPATAAAA